MLIIPKYFCKKDINFYFKFRLVIKLILKSKYLLFIYKKTFIKYQNYKKS